MIATDSHASERGPFQILAEALAQPVWTLDADGHLRYGNRFWRSHFSIEAGAAFLQEFTNILHPDDRQHYVDVWQQALSTKQSYRIVRRVRFKNDTQFHRQCEQGHPVWDAAGHVVEWILFATEPGDSTMPAAGQRLESAHHDQFLAMLVHEMRNPLAPIDNALHMLTLLPEDPQVVRSMRDVIARQLSQLTRLVSDLFDLVRFRHERFSLKRQTLDLAEVAIAAVETAAPIITSRKHRLATSLQSGQAIVNGDAARLTQVLTNLLINAAKFTEEGGHLSITLETEPDVAIVKVCDSGVGISADLLPRVFDAYVQGARSPAESLHGLGLGLPLARQLVEMHGGTLSAHSEGPGKGSEFVARLPRSLLPPPSP